MDWTSYILGLLTAALLWFCVQVGRASERRELRRRLQGEEGIEMPGRTRG